MIREYEQRDEDKVVRLWNSTLEEDKITVEKFRKQALLDDNFDTNLCLVYEVENQIVGFILATKRKFPYLDRGLEPTRGWINVVFVDKKLQKKGIGTQLMRTAETKLKSLGATEIILATYSPNYFLSGVDTKNYPTAASFFEGLGYLNFGESFSMCRDLHGYKMSIDIEQKMKRLAELGYQFIRYSPNYLIKLLDFARDEFGGGWKRNLLISMQKGTAEDTVLLILDKDDDPVAFCMRAIDDNPLRFGPIGVAESIRNLGLGGVLLEWQMEEMSKRGYYHMFFLSTDIPGRRFYERHGLHVFRTFINYRKELL